MDGEEELCTFPSFPVLEAHSSIWNSVWFSIVLWRPFSAQWGTTLCAYKGAEMVCLAQQAAWLSPFNKWSLPTWHCPRAGNAKLTGVFAFRGCSYCGEEASDRWFQGLEEKALGGICTSYYIIGEGLLSSVWDFSKGNDAWVSLSWRTNSK